MHATYYHLYACARSLPFPLLSSNRQVRSRRSPLLGLPLDHFPDRHAGPDSTILLRLPCPHRLRLDLDTRYPRPRHTSIADFIRRMILAIGVNILRSEER